MSLLRFLSPPGPDAAIAIGAEQVAVATLSVQSGRPALTTLATEPLPPGSVAPSLLSANIPNPAPVAAALERCFERAGVRPRRVALVVPDLCAKVSLVRFDSVPAKRADLDQLIRWQIRKASPFPIDEAVVTSAPALAGSDGSHEFLVVSARRQVIVEYERVCDAVRAHAGLVELSTLSLLNFVLAGAAGAGDTLVVHAEPRSTAIAILRGGAPIFIRMRPEDDAEPLVDLVHQTAMYYQDRLGGEGFSRVLLAGGGRDAADITRLQQDLESRLGTPVERLDARRVIAVADRVHGAADAGAVIPPLCGVLLRDSQDRQVA